MLQVMLLGQVRKVLKLAHLGQGSQTHVKVHYLFVVCSIYASGIFIQLNLGWLLKRIFKGEVVHKPGAPGFKTWQLLNTWP